MITIGIDIGGSTTKIAGLRGGEIVSPMLVKANDPIASMFGAFGKFTAQNNLSLGDISHIVVTGVGASYVDKPIYGLPTAKAVEFLCVGLGGLHLSGLGRAMIVSMGTGTALVHADENKIEHMGGTAIGGGTILGLSSRLLNIRDIGILIKTAEGGDLKNVDLMVSDITRDILPTLPPETTASNFGRLSDVASHADIALGIFNMVFQSIGMTAVFSVRNTDISDIVFIGSLTTVPYNREIFRIVSALSGVNFVIPENAEYATAVGAALTFINNRKYVLL